MTSGEKELVKPMQKARRRKRAKVEKEQSEQQANSASGASSSGLIRVAPGEISHLPRSTHEAETYCVIKQQRNLANRRPFEFTDADPTISLDESYPRTTTCPDCNERVNIWITRDNRNGNAGRRYTKCSNKHFHWCDVVLWEHGRKVVRKKPNL